MPWEQLPLGDLSAGGVLVLVFLLVLAGRLIPKSWVDRLIAQKDSEIADLKEINRGLRKSLDLNTHTTERALGQAELGNDLMKSIKERQSPEGE